MKANAIQIGGGMMVESLDSDHSKHWAMETATATDFLWKKVFYKLQTTCSDIVVDGFRVTNYTNALEVFQVSHEVMTPLRATTL